MSSHVVFREKTLLKGGTVRKTAFRFRYRILINKGLYILEYLILSKFLVVCYLAVGAWVKQLVMIRFFY
jgi:hypothetical protein